jgi:hypothetical protein
MAPAIFELDENGEATGQVTLFCSEKCACKFQNVGAIEYPSYSHGKSEVTMRGLVCVECGESLDEL